MIQYSNRSLKEYLHARISERTNQYPEEETQFYEHLIAFVSQQIERGDSFKTILLRLQINFGRSIKEHSLELIIYGAGLPLPADSPSPSHKMVKTMRLHAAIHRAGQGRETPPTLEDLSQVTGALEEQIFSVLSRYGNKYSVIPVQRGRKPGNIVDMNRYREVENALRSCPDKPLSQIARSLGETRQALFSYIQYHPALKTLYLENRSVQKASAG